MRVQLRGQLGRSRAPGSSPHNVIQRSSLPPDVLHPASVRVMVMLYFSIWSKIFDQFLPAPDERTRTGTLFDKYVFLIILDILFYLSLSVPKYSSKLTEDGRWANARQLRDVELHTILL